ncbi:hypothetical protein ACFLQ8_03655 [Candidatus Auribacterota bacterium]
MYFETARLPGNMTCDHVQILVKDEDDQAGLDSVEMSLSNMGAYTTNSKESVHIAYLLGLIRNEPAFAHVKLDIESGESGELRKRRLEVNNSNVARLRLLKKLKTHISFGKLMPWVRVEKDGMLTPTTDFIPSLDNGQTSWSLIAVLGALGDKDDPISREIVKLTKDVLSFHDYSPFYDPGTGLLFAECNLNLSRRETYRLSDMYEGTMAVLFAVLNGQVPESAWDNLKIDTVPYTTQKGEVIDALKGYRGSFHELWALGWLPYMDSSLAPVIRNFMYVQLDLANKNGLPGPGATCYTSKGYQQVGPSVLASSPGDREDVATAYATAMTMLVDRDAGLKWVENLWKYPGMTGRYGIIESVSPDAYANILTTDSKGLILLCMSGGVNKEVEIYLKTHNVPGTNIKMYDKLMQLLERKFSQLMVQRMNAPVRTFTGSYPMPSGRQMKVVKKAMPEAKKVSELTRSMYFEHHHGLNVDENWRRRGGGLVMKYRILRWGKEQYAWKGTFITPQTIFGMNYISVTVPAKTPRYVFNIEIKNSLRNFLLVHAIIDTSLVEGLTGKDEHIAYSPDGRWKTITKRIFPSRASEKNSADYVGFTIDNPKFNNNPYSGAFEIKEIVLSAANPVTGDMPGMHISRFLNIPGAENILPPITWPQGGLKFHIDAEKGTVLFHDAKNWRGGYVSPPVQLGAKYAGGHMNVIVKNLEIYPVDFLIEPKNNNVNLLGERFKVTVPVGENYHVVQVPLEVDKGAVLNYIAVSNFDGKAILGAITFGKEPAGETYAIAEERTVPLEGGKDLSSPGITVPAEIPDKAIAAELKKGVIAKKPDGTLVKRRLVKDKIKESPFEDDPLNGKIERVKALFNETINSMDNVPPNVKMREVIKAASGADIVFVDGYTVGDDVFAHTGAKYNSIYIGRDLAEAINEEDLARLVLEEAFHIAIPGGDAEHNIIKHDEKLRQKLLKVILNKGPRSELVKNKLAFLKSGKVDKDITAVKRSDPELRDSMSVIYMTVDPDFMINLHNEIASRNGRKNFKVIPVYRDSFMRSFDYLSSVADEYKDILLQPIEIDELNNYKDAARPVEDAAVNYASEMFPDKNIKAVNVGWINSKDEKYAVANLTGPKPKILVMEPGLPVKGEIVNIGRLLDIMEIGLMARRLAGDRIDKITFEQLAQYLDSGIRTQFLDAIADLGISKDSNVLDVVKQPVPVKSADEGLINAISSLKQVITAA